MSKVTARTDELLQVSPCSGYSGLVLLQDELLCAETIVLNVRWPMQHPWIKVERLQPNT